MCTFKLSLNIVAAFFIMVKIIETPRDGFQGLKQIIPTPDKIKYINALLKVGFDTIDIGSIVSSVSVPQMADTADLINRVDLSDSNSKLMVLVANMKGAMQAANFEVIDELAFPFSISTTFLKKNIKSDFEKSEKLIQEILNLSLRKNKDLIVYIAMGFGNPYGDHWDLDLIHEWVDKFVEFGIQTIPLSDITGESDSTQITEVYKSLKRSYPDVEFGLHLHAKADDYIEKVKAAYDAGCRRFDSVLGGIGGCPMTGYELLANLNTMDLIKFLEDENESLNIDRKQLLKSEELLKKLL